MLGHTAPTDPSVASQKTRFVPRLRLFTEALLVSDGARGHREEAAAVVSLRFVYAHGEVRGAGSHDDELVVGDDMRSGPVDRDPIAEAHAQRLVEGFGAVEIGCLEHVVAPVGSQADYLVHVDGDVHALCSFTAYAVPRLRELGWQVEIADDYPYQVVDAAAGWYAAVEEDARPDWFGLELGVDVDGQRVNLVPALIELIEQSGGASLESLTRVPARMRALPVAPNRYVTLAPDRLARILRVLRDLYTGARVSLGPLRFPGAFAPMLAELDTVLTEGGPVAWRGTTAPVERARALACDPSFWPQPVGLRATLRPYQHAGLNWMQHLREHDAAGVLADDMGLGKTLQTIAHLAAEKEARRLDRPSLIVMPTSLVGNWQRELRKFAPHLRVVVWHGPNRRRNLEPLRRAEVVLTTYPLMCRDQELFESLELHYLVLDEAQAVKNPRSQAAAAARALTARHRLCLTGTPIENNLEELWSLFQFLMPGMLGTAEQFRQRFRTPIEQVGDDERLEALRERVAPFILRRLKETVASELPPKTVLVRPVELAGDQRDLYESIRIAAHADVRKVIRENTFARSTIAVLDALMKLRQVCCDPRLLAVPAARDVQGSAKYQALLSLLERQLAQGRRVLVFSQFTRMLALISEGLLERGVRHLTLTGQTTDRQARVDAFEQGKADVFLISLKAGGTGLNLVSADTVIHYDPWWNAAAQAQAEDRAYRIGQSRPVFVHNLIVAGSVEERMLRLQERKKHLADTLLGGGGARSALTEHDVHDLFAPLGDGTEAEP
jgi:superfamily II DNA or RNA helicase